MRLLSHAASANCLKVRTMLRLLGRAHVVEEVDIFAGETLTDAFAAVNPVREVPVLVLDEGTPLAQSAAICVYLADATAWAGADALERAQVVAWLVFESEHVVPGIGGVRFRAATGRAGEDELAARREGGRAALDVLAGHLATRDWLVGAGPTVADICVWAYAHLADEAGLPLARWPAVAAWCARVEALPGVVDDLAPYAANAAPGRGRSIYG